jgi:hypothetical protein
MTTTTKANRARAEKLDARRAEDGKAKPASQPPRGGALEPRRVAKEIAEKAHVSRGPFAHAADYRDALAALDAVLVDLERNGPTFEHHSKMRGDLGLSGSAAPGFLRSGNDMIERGLRLRQAARRLLVATCGAKHARRWDGWKRPRTARSTA